MIENPRKFEKGPEMFLWWVMHYGIRLQNSSMKMKIKQSYQLSIIIDIEMIWQKLN